jgi:flagellar export protein FliJ
MSLTPQRLKKLVTYRERLEHVQEGKLGVAQRSHQQRERALADTSALRESLFEAGWPAAGAFEPIDLELVLAYVGRLEREIAATNAALVHSANGVAFEREQLLIRRRDRKAMETLLDRERESERKAALRKEQRVLDEVALRGWPSTSNGTEV